MEHAQSRLHGHTPSSWEAGTESSSGPGDVNDCSAPMMMAQSPAACDGDAAAAHAAHAMQSDASPDSAGGVGPMDTGTSAPGQTGEGDHLPASAMAAMQHIMAGRVGANGRLPTTGLGAHAAQSHQSHQSHGERAGSADASSSTMAQATPQPGPQASGGAAATAATAMEQ